MIFYECIFLSLMLFRYFLLNHLDFSLGIPNIKDMTDIASKASSGIFLAIQSKTSTKLGSSSFV